MMKIAYLVNQYPQPSHSFIRREIRALEECGVPITRISVRRGPAQLIDPADREEAGRTRVVLDHPLRIAAATLLRAATSPIRFLRTVALALELGRRSHRGSLVHLIYAAEACLIASWLAGESVTHVHAHFGTNAAAVALLLRRLTGITYSFTVHGPEEFDAPEALSLPRKIAEARFVVAVSSFGRSQLCRWTPAASWDKLRVVHCGVDASFLEAAAVPPPDGPDLTCIGRLSEQKGHLLLLQAVAELVRAGVAVRLKLIGDGPLRPVIERRIAELGLQEAVTLCGWMTNAEIREVLTTSRALVLASFAEGLPVVIMEALALRRPVLSTAIAGTPELVEPGVSGWLVPAGSVEALRDALREVLRADPAELQRLGTAGARRVAEQHSAVKEAQKLRELFASA